jgi:ABC-type branched-subunit amino acid transport system ATPase component
MLRRRLPLVLAGTAVLASVAAASPAAAADVDDAGWWWRVQDAPVAVPAPPTVPEDGLMVQGTPTGPSAIAAVRYAGVAGQGAPVLTLRLADGSRDVRDGVVLACPPAAAWTGGRAQRWQDRPGLGECASPAAADVADDGRTVSFVLGRTDGRRVVDVVLVPATTDGAAFNGTNGATFTLVLEPPQAGDLSVAAPPVTGSTAGAPRQDAAAPGTSVAGPPLPAARPAVPVDVPAAALPTEVVAPAPPVAAAAPAEPAPPVALEQPPLAVLPAAAPDPGPSLGDLLPLLLVLALGPAALLASRQPRIARALGPLGFAPADRVPLAVALRSSAAAQTAPVPAPAGAPRAPLLECRGVAVRFGGLQALGGVDLEVYEGEIVGLIGPNGAGKTTLMECISGFQPVTAGTIRYRGEDLLARSAGQRAALGIGRTLQDVRLFPYLTVLDNLRVALHRHQGATTVAHALRLPAAREEQRALLEEAERILSLIGMEAFGEKFASELSYGTLRLLELGCMLALRPSFLLLDEPASGISQKETEALGPLLRDIQRATGATILMIEHDMPLVMGLSDRVYCLDAGTELSAGTPEQVSSDPKVAEAYLGTPREQRKVATAASRPEDTTAELLLEVQGLDVFYDKVQVLYDVDFHVRRGERVALLGTNGAGKSTVLKAASGLVTPRAGSVRWKGEDVLEVPAEQLMRRGLGQVPGGRGLFPTLTVGENLRMGGYVYGDQKRVDEEVERVLEYFPWIADRSDQPAGTLSGGEQQQLATARALMARPELLMIDELSLGLAPIMVERLMDIVQRLCEDEGLTVVIVEQQASFALGYTDRAYFMEKGEVRYAGPSAGLSERGDLLRSVFLAGAAAGFAGAAQGASA